MPRDCFEAQPVSDRWVELSFFLDDPRKKRGGFLGWSTAPVMEQHVRDAMVDIVEPAGELLPGMCEDVGPIYFLNVLENLDCFDEDRAIEDAGVKRWAFHPDRIGDCSLFKLSAFPFSPLFTYTGKLDPDKEFKNRYERLGLGGLKFQLVWSDEIEGGTELPALTPMP